MRVCQFRHFGKLLQRLLRRVAARFANFYLLTVCQLVSNHRDEQRALATKSQASPSVPPPFRVRTHRTVKRTILPTGTCQGNGAFYGCPLQATAHSADPPASPHP